MSFFRVVLWSSLLGLERSEELRRGNECGKDGQGYNNRERERGKEKGREIEIKNIRSRQSTRE